MEKFWILCRKYCWKHSHSSVMHWDSVIQLTFSTVFSTQNPTFLHHELIFRKNMVYMKNAEERAGLKIFSQKLLKMKSSLSKSTKTVENCANYLLYGFLKELMMYSLSKFSPWWRAWLWSDVSPLLEICFRKYFLWVTTRSSMQKCIKIIAGTYWRN